MRNDPYPRIESLSEALDVYFYIGKKNAEIIVRNALRPSLWDDRKSLSELWIEHYELQYPKKILESALELEGYNVEHILSIVRRTYA